MRRILAFLTLLLPGLVLAGPVTPIDSLEVNSNAQFDFLLSQIGLSTDSSGNLIPVPTQSAHTVWAGPTSGSAATPTFRFLIGTDLPLPTASTLGGIESAAAVSHQWINSISTSGVPASSQPAFADLSGSVIASQMPALTGDAITSAGAVAVTVKGINGTLLSGLATGVLMNTTTTGVPSILGFTGGSLTFSAGNLLLSGDATSPGNSFFYGTSSSGTKGWNALSTYLASPAAIGGTTPAAGTFTNLLAKGTSSSSAFTITQTVRTSGVLAYAVFNTPADTGITAATESNDIQFGSAGIRTWATTGTVTLQRTYLFKADTLASASASQTFTTAATVDITGAPIAGTNAIIGIGYALNIEAGGMNVVSGSVNLGSGTTTVGGASTLTGTVTWGSASGGVLAQTLNAGTNAAYVQFQNTGGLNYFGVNNSTGSTLAGTANALVAYGATEFDAVAAGVVAAKFISTGATIPATLTVVGNATFDSGFTQAPTGPAVITQLPSTGNSYLGNSSNGSSLILRTSVSTAQDTNSLILTGATAIFAGSIASGASATAYYIGSSLLAGSSSNNMNLYSGSTGFSIYNNAGTGIYLNINNSNGSVAIPNGSLLGTTSALTVGIGGSSSIQNLLINGGTGTAQGSEVVFQENGTNYGYIGTSSAVIGGASTNDYYIRAPLGQVVLQSASSTALILDSAQRGVWSAGVADKSTALTYASPTVINPALGNVFTVTTVNATGSVTFNASSAGLPGQHMWIYILNDATSGKTITWGTNLDPQASTLVGISSKGSMIEFVSDGTSFREVGRITGLL